MAGCKEEPAVPGHRDAAIMHAAIVGWIQCVSLAYNDIMIIALSSQPLGGHRPQRLGNALPLPPTGPASCHSGRIILPGRGQNDGLSASRWPPSRWLPPRRADSPARLPPVVLRAADHRQRYRKPWKPGRTEPSKAPQPLPRKTEPRPGRLSLWPDQTDQTDQTLTDDKAVVIASAVTP